MAGAGNANGDWEGRRSITDAGLDDLRRKSSGGFGGGGGASASSSRRQSFVEESRDPRERRRWDVR